MLVATPPTICGWSRDFLWEIAQEDLFAVQVFTTLWRTLVTPESSFTPAVNGDASGPKHLHPNAEQHFLDRGVVVPIVPFAIVDVFAAGANKQRAYVQAVFISHQRATDKHI